MKKEKKDKGRIIFLIGGMLLAAVLFMIFFKKPMISGLSDRKKPVNDAIEIYKELAIRDLSDRLDINGAVIDVGKIEEREFRDSSLGCPKKGGIYAQIITRGYVILLTANGKSYEYHAGSKRVVFCDRD